MLRLRTPREVFAPKFAALSSASQGGRCESYPSVWAASGPRTPPTSFCKRCVPVASCSVVLRPVAYVSPKTALRGAVQKSRRAAWTDKSMRMSGRLAHLQSQKADMPETVSLAARTPTSQLESRSVAWRSLHSVVAEVLRDARISPSPLPHRGAVETALKSEL